MSAGPNDAGPPPAPDPRLAHSTEMLSTLVDQDLFGVYVIQDGRFRFVNRTFARIFGYSPEEIVDRLGPAELTAPSDRERVLENVRRRADGEIQQIQYAFRGLRKDGSEVPVQVHGGRAQLRGDPAVSGVLLDMTEHQELQEQLRQTQKREALAELTGAVAHDFNNFLTGVIGSVELALWDLDPDSEAARNLGLARSTAERASVLTRRLLTFARKDVRRPETFDLSAVATDMSTLLHQLVGSPIRLDLEVGPVPVWVHLDRGHVEQIVMNLVVNARDAMPEGGTIVVRTHIVEDATTGRLLAVLEVRDDGEGMDEETLARIFSPFFTTKTSGTGLGLATVRRIVEDADGDAEVESEPGRGTTFRIRRPMVEKTEDAGRSEAPVDRTGVPRPGSRILVVEDDEAVKRMVESALTRHGCRVEAVPTARAALDAAEGGRRFDLVLTDISLPDVNGVELARALRAVDPGLSIVFSSGYSPEEWPGGGWTAGGAEILRKPYSVDELVWTVAAALESEWRGEEGTG